MITIGILKESDIDRRVSLLPSEVEHFTKQAEFTVYFERGLGEGIGISDQEYALAGGIAASKEQIYLKSNVVVSIHHQFQNEPTNSKIKLVGIFNLLFHQNRLESYSKNSDLSVYSLDLIPRSTLAQSMDVLSSMASLAGYKAVMTAASEFKGVLPMFTTAAGTIRPATVLVLGAGVAGLQAIATAKRMGAVVKAFDVRRSAAEEVKSLGANFIEVPGFTESETSGGYAVEQSEEYKQKQKELVSQQVALADIVICTANIPGKKAPRLIDLDTVEKMKKGSCIIDMAAEQGGNCELSPLHGKIDYQGITIIAHSHLASEVPLAASKLLSNNYKSFLNHLFKHESNPDQILTSTNVIANGEINHDSFRQLLEKV
ncbi:MAG: NAD(P) transhydrogenase subunit alpha [Bacteroidetes bacterium]|nr:NAD(P) transhydrogenase subunit alpha [Bacteroidota bacterium]